MTTTAVMTAADLERMPDDGSRYELVRGVVRRMAPANLRHGRVGDNLQWRLSSFARKGDLGYVTAEVGFRLERDPDTVLAPDVAFLRAERVPPTDQQYGFVDAPPDLAVEVLSPSNSMARMGEKVLTYLRAGVRLVWLLDPIGQTVTVYAPDRTARILLDQETLDGGDVLPGFAVQVADLFT